MIVIYKNHNLLKTICFVMIGLVFHLNDLQAQSFNKEIKEGEDKSPILLGKINKQGLLKEPFQEWFSKGYQEYKPDAATIDTLKENLKAYTIKLFMGTWCGDSKREVPHFYKVLDAADFPLERLTTIAVHNKKEAYKQSPGGEHEGVNIHRVPTFILYKNDIEVNRIVESPKNTLEADLLALLNDDYTPNYETVTIIDQLLQKKGSAYIAKEAKKIAPQLSSKTESLYELNTYANVLFFSGKKQEAIEVLKLNLFLFPKEADAYISLGNKFLVLNDTAQALIYYKQALEYSENDQIKKRIDALKMQANKT